MKFIFLGIVFLAFHATVSAFGNWNLEIRSSKIEPASISKAAKTYVVNHEFCSSCLSEEENENKEALEDLHTYAELKNDPRADLPSSFTICSSAMTTYGSQHTLFTLLGNDGNKWLAAKLSVDGKTTFFYWKWADVELPPVFAHQWVRSCIAIDTERGLLQWVVDGALVENATDVPFVKDTRNKPTDLSGKIILGAWQRSGSNKWMSRARTSNQVTNLNIFSRALTIREMEQNTEGGDCSPAGDYLAWEQMQWELKGRAVIESVDEQEPCMGDPSLNLYPAGYTSMESCRHFCQKIGSRSPSLATLQRWTDLQRDLEGMIKKKEGRQNMNIWHALDDEGTEGEWVDYYDRTVANYSLPWFGSEPNGGSRENCAVLRLSTRRLYDYPCDHPNYAHACMCERTPTPYLRLWGLCSTTAVRDTLFQPMNNLTDFSRLTLVGLRTLIEFDATERTWILTDAESNVTGVSRAPHNSYTLGRHNWTIRGDGRCSRDGREYTTELKMSGCQAGNFTCNDGQCVSMDQRCNQLLDCRDKSDEENCNILVFEKSYNKNVPPINSSDPVNVTLSIDLFRLVDIDEEDYSIEIQFEIMLRWKENRIRYHNLKKTTALNALTQENIQKLWLPEVIYENTDQKESTRIGEYGGGEWKTNIVVIREEEKGTMSGLDSVDETEVFSGSLNSLVMNQSYTHTFQCNYEFSHYPFDTQVHQL